jgi:hypothetical protein
MNLVFIENTPGSGQIITVSEVFNGCVVSHRLEPGDSARIVTSRFKSIVIDEEVVSDQGLANPADRRENPSPDSDGLRPPRRREVGRSLAHRLRRNVSSEIMNSVAQLKRCYPNNI